MKKWIRILCVILLICLLPAALADSTACKVNTSTKVYKTASTSSQSLKVSKGTSVTLLSSKNDWAYVERKGVKAYIPLKYLTLTKPVTAYTKDTAKIYKKPSTSSGTVATAKKATTVYIIGRDGDYFHVQNKSGSKSGYVKTSLLTDKKPSVTDEEKIDAVIAFAKTKIGCKYVLGKSGPKQFDCSGFVRNCYEQIGVKLSSSAKQQGYTSDYKRIKNRSDLRKGDIVCFNTEEDSDLSDHVGIYLGSGKFIHASSAARQVTISSFTSYYTRNFSWAIRIL